MAIDVKAEEVVADLRAAFGTQIRTVLAILPPHEALQLADLLCTTWLETMQGMRITHRALPKHDPVAIAEDWSRGLTWREITRKHGCSRDKAYECHPTKRIARGAARQRA